MLNTGHSMSDLRTNPVFECPDFGHILYNVSIHRTNGKIIFWLSHLRAWYPTLFLVHASKSLTKYLKLNMCQNQNQTKTFFPKNVFKKLEQLKLVMHASSD